MAETGKLGTAESLLASVQLALAAADATPPSITTEGGRLGGQLGRHDSCPRRGSWSLDLQPLGRERAGRLRRRRTLRRRSRPTLPLIGPWVVKTPAWARRSRRLPGRRHRRPRRPSRPAGSAWPWAAWFSGWTAPLARMSFCMMAESVLAIAHTADPAPTFVAHVAPRWVLGGQDAYLGGEQLAFAGADEPRPATGDRTGKLGTANSLLAGDAAGIGRSRRRRRGNHRLRDRLEHLGPVQRCRRRRRARALSRRCPPSDGCGKRRGRAQC